MTLCGGAARHECFSVGASASFQLGPALLHPALNHLIVALGRAARRPLARPVQLVASSTGRACSPLTEPKGWSLLAASAARPGSAPAWQSRSAPLAYRARRSAFCH